MEEFNILFTSAGRRVSLIQHFRQALYSLQVPGRIITADKQKNAPAFLLGDIRKLVPSVTDLNYLEELMGICRDYGVRLLIPLIDTELNLLATYQEDFAAMGVTVLVSSPEANRICFDKRNTYQFFKSIGMGTAAIYDPEALLRDSETKYPLFLKPADGSCSIGATKINNARELEFFKNYIPNCIVQEYLSGNEFTLDVLADFQGRVRTVVPRLRLETRAGEISKGITVKDAAIIAAGKEVVDSLPGAVGCITVQCFKTPDGDIKFTEINPRFGGGIPLSIKAGADFPRWIIEMLRGNDPQIGLDDWQEDLVMLRYDDELFVTKDEIL
ncbi:MAG: ATP-grasp domain-containing protein [Anaerolineaceae bacterium]|nr:ATP-grasp domain-containing protein [Anaerolineaceae bacterium]